MTDTKQLRELIKASGLKYGFIANALELTMYGLQKKIDNDSEFKSSEIKKLCDILKLTIEQMEQVFFAH